MTLHLVTDLALPALWDGHAVGWTLQAPVEGRIFICPPPKQRDRCPGCGLGTEPVVWRGLVHPLEGETVMRSVTKTLKSGRKYSVDEPVPAWATLELICWRCPNCRVDQVWDMRTDETWILGPEDYGPLGSNPPTPADEGRLF